MPPVRASPVRAFRDTFRNDQFLYFLPTFVLFGMSVTLLTAAMPFYADSVVLADGPLEVSVLGRSFELEEGAKKKMSHRAVERERTLPAMLPEA